MENRSPHRRAAVALILLTVAVAVAARAQVPPAPQSHQPPREEFTNLKVFPKDVAPAELRATMNGFTRALGVRCIHCHVGVEGKPFKHEDFAKDDKPTKLKARVMMQMTKDLNEKYIATLEHPADPPIRVQCVTCHRGAPQPRMLQDVLKVAWVQGGMDSTTARYQSLRDRYYGSFTYDFGEVPLADLAGILREAGHTDDALKLHSFNVEMNPKSGFARRQHAGAAMFLAFHDGGVDSGKRVYSSMQALYGPTVVTEGLLNRVGYDVLGTGQVPSAVAVFELNAAEHPESGNAYDSLGEAYLAAGDRRRALSAYTRAVALDSTNAGAKAMVEELKKPAQKAKKH